MDGERQSGKPNRRQQDYEFPFFYPLSDQIGLIEIGAVVESVLGREFSEGDNIRLMNFLKSQNERGNYFNAAMQKPVVDDGITFDDFPQ